MLMDEAFRNLHRTKEISVSTFRADDEKGTDFIISEYTFFFERKIEKFLYRLYQITNFNPLIPFLLSLFMVYCM